MQKPKNYLQPIAIIGMAGRFPGANSTAQLWENLKQGVESISFFSSKEALECGADPKLVQDVNHVKAFGVIDDIEMFDAPFFHFSPREASYIDPQHRLFLEHAWHSLENAGYDPYRYPGKIGVYAGSALSTYLLRNLLFSSRLKQMSRFEIVLNNSTDAVPMRTSFKLDLKGPSLNINNSCATSLVATHIACQGLMTYQCDIALAGGVHVRVPQKLGYMYQKRSLSSPDGHCRAFDKDAQGIVPGNGVGVVVLKRLDDAIKDRDTIYAVIKSSAVNNDGNKVSYLMPSEYGQAKVIIDAMRLAGVDPKTISYIEAHGAATEVGDPIEIKALTQAFKCVAKDWGYDLTDKSFCGVGSVKTNLGHLVAAAGVTGLIKTALALHHRQIPASLHYKQSNPKIKFAETPFYVNATLKDLQKTDPNIPLRAGVSSFGAGGTNAHVILEEAMIKRELQLPNKNHSHQLLLLSAKTPNALDKMTNNLAEHLEKYPKQNFADIAYTLQVGRSEFLYRKAIVAKNAKDAVDTIQNTSKKMLSQKCYKRKNKHLIFLFPGQGFQHINMAQYLYQKEPVFKKWLDYSSNFLEKQIGINLQQILYPSPKQKEHAKLLLETASIAQPAVVAIEYAMVKLLEFYDIKPNCVIGHSLGEYSAACIAGVMTLETALDLVAHRGAMMDASPAGKMIAVSASELDLQRFLSNEVSLAVINGSENCVLSGAAQAIDKVYEELLVKKIDCRRLHISIASHSSMMLPIADSFEEQVGSHSFQKPQIPYLSGVTGSWAQDELTQSQYWRKHLVGKINFNCCIEELLEKREQILIEVAPGRTLSSLFRKHPKYNDSYHSTINLLGHPNEQEMEDELFLQAFGKMWLNDIHINWEKLHKQQCYRVPLPGYAFQRERHWIDREYSIDPIEASQETLTLGTKITKVSTKSIKHDINKKEQKKHKDLPLNEQEKKVAKAWEQILGAENIDINESFFDLGGDSLTMIKLMNILQIEVPIAKMFKASTIAEQARMISKDVSLPVRNLPSCIVEMKSGEEHQPLFLVHPIGGYTLLYKDLCNSLRTYRSVFAFQSPGLNDEEEIITSIKNMAVHYIQAMKSIQPQGPYLIGGSSFGGVVAFEMAQQLLQKNEDVQLLFLIDAPSVGKTLFFNQTHPVVVSMLKQLSKLNIDTKKIQSVMKANNKALQNYQPMNYQKHFVFFRAQQISNNFVSHPEHFWLDKAENGIEIYTIPGDHITMNHNPNAKILAEKLDTIMERA